MNRRTVVTFVLVAVLAAWFAVMDFRHPTPVEYKILLGLLLSGINVCVWVFLGPRYGAPTWAAVLATGLCLFSETWGSVFAGPDWLRPVMSTTLAMTILGCWLFLYKQPKPTFAKHGGAVSPYSESEPPFEGKP